LPVGDKGRKYKGRVVFAGDRVKDQHGAVAVFEELASSPAGMEASKVCDAYGMLAGNVLQSSDAEQAYCQADLDGTETWIRVPATKRKAEWGNKVMVLPLHKALYGHPNSGVYWERHCEERVFKLGFVKIGSNAEWRSCYFHPVRKIFLMIYVDDFKMVGPISPVAQTWTELQAVIKMTAPEPVTHFLGCAHHMSTVVGPLGQPIRLLQYDMGSFLDQCVSSYEELAGPGFKCKPVSTPFIEEDDQDNCARAPMPVCPLGKQGQHNSQVMICPWCTG